MIPLCNTSTNTCSAKREQCRYARCVHAVFRYFYPVAPQTRWKRKIGAQNGHERHQRPAFPESDIQSFHDYRLDACPECGPAGIIFVDQPPCVIQQMELRETLVHKEEHRSYPLWCENCGKFHYHPFPERLSRKACSRSGSAHWWHT